MQPYESALAEQLSRSIAAVSALPAKMPDILAAAAEVAALWAAQTEG